MWGMFINSLKLFFKGKLFRDPRVVFRQWFIGFVICVCMLLLLAKLGLPVWLAVLLASLVAGGLQPLLFKNLKYA